MLSPRYVSASTAQRDFSLAPGALAERVVLVTGATGGLGTSLCLALGAAGATLALVARSEAKLGKLYDALVANGAPTPAIVPLEQSSASEAHYHELAELVDGELGRLDALVHASAAFGAPTPMDTLSHADWTRAMAVNVTAARLASLACLPRLEASPLASLTFLLDHRPGAYWGAYGISKQALHALMHMLDDEHEGRRDGGGDPRVAVNGYDPGPMRTPLRRRAFPGERESEAPLPAERLGPLLSLIARADRSLTGTPLRYD